LSEPLRILPRNTKLGKLMRYTVEQWLKHNGIETDKIIYCNEDKTAAIKDNKIDIEQILFTLLALVN